MAYSWAKHRQDLFELRTTPVRDGGSMRIVATMSAGVFMRLHDWSKDGKWIVVERGDVSATATVDLVVINATDGTSRVVQTAKGWSPTSRLVFSPDSGYLALDRPAFFNAAQHDVFVLSGELEPRQVASRAADNRKQPDPGRLAQGPVGCSLVTSNFLPFSSPAPISETASLPRSSP